MDKNYIAGFFDAEGSAMVLTIRRNLKTGVVYRFRPAIRIFQGTRSILENIQNYLGLGHIDKQDKLYALTINSLDGVSQFIKVISPYCELKKEVLNQLMELCNIQLKDGKRYRNFPYSREDTIKILTIREKIYSLNDKTRRNLKRKYPADLILAESNFVEDPKEWMRQRDINRLAASKLHPRGRNKKR